MKKTIKIEVPGNATPKLVNVGDDGWAVEFEDAKPEIEIGSWWVAPELDSHTGPFKVVNITGARASVEYYNGDRTTYSMPSVYFLPIPTKPDEDELKKQGYEFTGEVREPKEGESFVVREGNYTTIEGVDGRAGNSKKYGRRRWIVRKIALKGLDLLKTLVPGDYVAINGAGVFISFDVTKIRFIPEKDTGMWFTIYNNNTVDWELQFERAIGMKVSDITESHIEWRWKAPR